MLCISFDICFEDISDMPSPLCYDSVSDAVRIVKLRGLVLDNKGMPTYFPVQSNKVIASTLLAGVCSVSHDGGIRPVTERPNKSSPMRRTSTVGDARASMAGLQSGTMGEEGIINTVDNDMPITFSNEAPFTWARCKPGYRQGNYIVDLPDNKFAVTVPGEPAIWIFSRKPPPAGLSSGNMRDSIGIGIANRNIALSKNSTANSNSASLKGKDGRASTSNLSATAPVMYLVEIQYFLRLETGQVIIISDYVDFNSFGYLCSFLLC
jgi:hypothetical protein